MIFPLPWVNNIFQNNSMDVLKSNKYGVLSIGKYKIKFAITKDNQYVFSERDICLFIGGRGGKNFKSLSAKNLQQFISPNLKSKLQNRLQYCNQNNKTAIYGYDISTVIEICNVRLRGPHNAAYLRAKSFQESLSIIGLTAIANEIAKNSITSVSKKLTTLDQEPDILTVKDIFNRIHQIIFGTHIPTHAMNNG